MSRLFSRRSAFPIYLTLLALAGLAFVLITTWKYGAGVSSDAARNLATADSLLEGRGFVDMLGVPFVLWPPLYPLLLAGLSWLTKWSTFQAAWYLNVLLLPLNLWLAGWFFRLIFKDKPLFAAAGALIVLLSRSTLRIHANVASEPLFITLMLLFFLAAAGYLRTGSKRWLWFMFVLAGLATLQRYLGVVLIGLAVLVVFFKAGWRGLLQSILPGLAAVVPIGLWSVLHNLPLSGGLFGPRLLGEMLPLENISLSLTKILWWFMPLTPPLDQWMERPWIILLALGLVVLILNRSKTAWLDWLKALTNPLVWPGLVFSVVYFFTLAFTVVTADHLDLTSDRYYVIILPVVLVFLFLTIDRLVLNHLDLQRPFGRYAAVAVLLLWFVYPLYSMQEYLRKAWVLGEPSNYNIANSAQYREMGVVKAGQKILAADPTALVYSNYVNIVWFNYYHHPVQQLPFEDTGQPRAQRLVSLQQFYPGWPRQSGYIVWFIPNQYHFYAPPDDLAAIANLKLLYQDKTGQIYYAQAP